jgi:hypothetical protein
VQIENLATLGKVWGFLKYHHPRVTSGNLHWDYELFRVLPAILEAPDRQAANAALLHWITKLGDLAPIHAYKFPQPPVPFDNPSREGINRKRTRAIGPKLSEGLCPAQHFLHATPLPPSSLRRRPSFPFSR